MLLKESAEVDLDLPDGPGVADLPRDRPRDCGLVVTEFSSIGAGPDEEVEEECATAPRVPVKEEEWCISFR